MIKIDYLKKIATTAGGLIRDNFCHAIETEWRDDGTPVTIIDKDINDLVLNTLSKEYPGVSVLSEEGSFVSESDWTIVCDPINGTSPYIMGVPLSTFSISAFHNGEQKMAVVHEPFRKKTYFAEKDKGSFCGTQRLKVSEQRKLSQKTHVHLMWWKDARFNFGPFYNSLVKAGIPCVNYGTVGIVGGLIAGGQIEASVFPGKNIWETAAMGFLVEEAGGLCTDIYGNSIDYSKNGKMYGHVVSNGFLHEEIIDLLLH